MEYHLTSLAMNFLCKIVEQKYLLRIENLAVVTLPLYDVVSTEDFVRQILIFQACNKLQLALKIVFNTWSTI